MAEEEKKTDEEWKRRVAEEKEAGEKEMKAEDLPPPAPDFVNLVVGIGTQALIQLGAVADPVTNKKKVSLTAAKYSIDLLGMLEEKTAGNLADEEKRHLEGLLYELRMRYVQATG